MLDEHLNPVDLKSPNDPSQPQQKVISNNPAPQSDTPTEEISDMETHAHALHRAPGHGWKHYLFEFLMLFMAVTLGFIVENFREHIVEHKRATQFLQSMLVDVLTRITWIHCYSRIVRLL
jgi:hypothetical protein